MTINGTKQDVCYKIAPYKGVNVCGDTDCSYVTSTRESKACPNHPNIKLEPTKDCLVDFYYVWPKNSEDKRRWIGGLLRCGDMKEKNLHSHPLNPPAKFPVKLEADIRQALVQNPRLKTSEIMIGMYMYNYLFAHKGCILLFQTGKGLAYMPSAASLAAAHKGKIKKIQTVNSA